MIFNMVYYNGIILASICKHLDLLDKLSLMYSCKVITRLLSSSELDLGFHIAIPKLADSLLSKLIKNMDLNKVTSIYVKYCKSYVEKIKWHNVCLDGNDEVLLWSLDKMVDIYKRCPSLRDNGYYFRSIYHTPVSLMSYIVDKKSTSFIRKLIKLKKFRSWYWLNNLLFGMIDCGKITSKLIYMISVESAILYAENGVTTFREKKEYNDCVAMCDSLYDVINDD